jgi:hypothetical protein
MHRFRVKRLDQPKTRDCLIYPLHVAVCSSHHCTDTNYVNMLLVRVFFGINQLYYLAETRHAFSSHAEMSFAGSSNTQGQKTGNMPGRTKRHLLAVDFFNNIDVLNDLLV